MWRYWSVAASLGVMACMFAVEASDPELTTDFTVPPDSEVDGNYFTFTGFRNFAATEGTFNFSKATQDVFPALEGLGVSFTMLQYFPNNTDPVHTHPRGTELLYLIDGTINVGLVDTSGKLYTQTLQQGDVFVIPKGLMHYHINLSKKVATSIAAYSSSNAGTLSLSKGLLASGIPSLALELAFRAPAEVIAQLVAPWQNTTAHTSNSDSCQ